MNMKIDLSGKWEFSFCEKFEDAVSLPGTTEQNFKGAYNPDPNQTLYLSQNYPFTGKAFYRKKVCIPPEWENKSVQLLLERTKYTEVFVDGKKISSSKETLIPQKHDLTAALCPGEHDLMIVVDNDLAADKNFPKTVLGGHQYTEHTQTNWNGIIGEIALYAFNCARPVKTKIFADIHSNTISAEINFENSTDETEFLLAFSVEHDDKTLASKEFQVRIEKGHSSVKIQCETPEPLPLWDEFHSNLCTLRFELLRKGNSICKWEETTGFREIKTKDKILVLNGNPLFLRGNLDCCIYPKTGACPMDLDSWMYIFRTMREYGMNHIRFHSWCPPKAAFEAGDRLGMYLQTELSCFGNGFYPEGHEKCDPALNAYLNEQSVKVLEEYGNHPSFLLFAVGNEMIGEIEMFSSLVKKLKTIRPDKLYSQGSNNFFENPISCPEDDFWVTMRVTKEDNVRGSFSHADKPLGHIQTEHSPGTLWNYSSAIEKSDVPVISHEVGQYQVYPDYREIEKHKGIFSPTALRIFKKRLEEKGMGDLADDFFKASGGLAVECYREDIEASLRTPGMGGFQLLSLQDFPGQGTALVGILDCFLDSKGLISPERWREFCAPQVILGQFPKYVYNLGEEIPVTVSVYNYGENELSGKLTVSLLQNGKIIDEAVIPEILAPRGKLSEVASVSLKTAGADVPCRLEMVLSCKEIINRYPIWVYPCKKEEAENVLVAKEFDSSVIEALQNGGRVVLFKSDCKNSVEGFFTPDFWCYSMFKLGCERKGVPFAPGTMGLLCDEKHPALKLFPTKNHSEWQWHGIAYYSRPAILDGTSHEFRPIVQVIDNFERNHKLGLLFETALFNGKLLVCTADVLSHMDLPEAKQFYNSILAYAKSDEFNPKNNLSLEKLKDVLQ
jgi:hypothetical protein